MIEISGIGVTAFLLAVLWLVLMFGYPCVAAVIGFWRGKQEKPRARQVDLPSVSIQGFVFFIDDLDPDRFLNELSPWGFRLVRDGAGKRAYPRSMPIEGGGDRWGKWRRIKWAAQNTTADWLVFTDASAKSNELAIFWNDVAMAAGDASNPVGLVSGRYILNGESAYQQASGLYWKIETAIKRFQSAAGVVVTPHGALYAVRRQVVLKAPEEVANDDLSLALTSLAMGFRNIYSEARVWETDLDSARVDFARRRRITYSNWIELCRVKFLWGHSAAPKHAAFHCLGHKGGRMVATVLFFPMIFFVIGALPMLWSIKLMALLVFAVGVSGKARFLFNTQLAGLVGFFSFMMGKRVAWK